MIQQTTYVRGALEREVSRLRAAPRVPHAAEAESDALELVLDGNQISQQQREWLERPENYPRPIRIREYWRTPGVEDDEVRKNCPPWRRHGDSLESNP